jgi:hypothetical protein
MMEKVQALSAWPRSFSFCFARWVLAHRQLLSCRFPASSGLGQTDSE